MAKRIIDPDNPFNDELDPPTPPVRPEPYPGEFPKSVYGPSGQHKVVSGPDEQMKLGPDWKESPVEVDG